jgi:5-amino-6-(5-phospho-D-ribitylamino)uracil phosphatase
MTIKSLYITDLDGTFLNSDKELSKYTINTINTLIAKGMNFSIATARTSASAIKILKDLNINLPVVFMNGVVIYDIGEEKYIKIEEIPEETTGEIIDILNHYKISGFMYGISEETLTTYYERMDTKAMEEFREERVRKYYKTFEQVDSFSSTAIGNKIIYFALIDEYERLEPVLNSLKTLEDIDSILYRDIYADAQWYLEIHSRKASKYNAVRFLREEYAFEKIIGFGDNYNDIPLFKACDESYAVSNAVEELKEIATGIVDDCNSDGVAKFIFEREK